METIKSSKKILKVILKNFARKLTITELAKEIKMTRVGVWKILKKMKSEKLIILSATGSGKTSTFTLSLNWDNPLIEKNLVLVLTEEALVNQRWLNNFKDLEKKFDFLMIYGSIIYDKKNANDLDLLGIVSNKKRFTEIDEIIRKIQKTQEKKIHLISLTKKELEEELLNKNKAFEDALKKGIVLFGPENFIKFLKEIK